MTQREEIDELRARVEELEGEKRAAVELWDHLFRACDEWPGGCGPGKKQWKEFIATFERDKLGRRDIVLAFTMSIPGTYSLSDAVTVTRDALARNGWTGAIVDMAPLDSVDLPTSIDHEALLARYYARTGGPAAAAAFEASAKRRRAG